MTAEKKTDKNPAHVGSACCAVALSLVLAGQWPAGAVAYAADGAYAQAPGASASSGESGDSNPADASSDGLGTEPGSADAIDVSADWGRDGFTINKAGRYVLSADVKDAGTLVVAAPKGEVVELDLCGHTVTFAETVACGIDLSASEGTVRIVDGAPRYRDAEKGKTADNLLPSLIMPATDPAENVYAVRIDAAPRAKDAVAPSIAFENVGVSVSVRVSTSQAASHDVAGMYVATRGADADKSDVADIVVKDTSIDVSVDAKDDAAREALAAGAGAQPESGAACALFTACAGIELDGSVSLAATDAVRPTDAAGAGFSCDIAATCEDAFSFGRDFKAASSLRANVKGNAEGVVLGHVADGFDAREASRLAFSAAVGEAAFQLEGEKYVVARVASTDDSSHAGDGASAEGGVPADGADSASFGETAPEASLYRDTASAEAEKQVVAAQSAGIIGRQALEGAIELADVSSPRVVASLVRDGQVKGSFGTVDDALSHMASGDTLRLESDASNLVFAQGGNTLVGYTIDLAGHTAASVTVSSDAAVSLTSSAQGGAIEASNAQGAALTYSGNGKLSVQGITISSFSGGVKACGIAVTGAGSMTLDGVDVTVSAQGVEARGINQTSKSGGALSIRGGSIDVSTSSASVATYGITASAQAKTLQVEDCPITVVGGQAACAIDSKGIVSVKGTSAQEKISVSAATASSSVWGIRAASASSSVWIANCAISVQARDVADGARAWCVTTGDDSTQNAVAITLDGACSFDSCTNTDISFYKTPLQLGESLKLGSGGATLYTRGLAGDVFASCVKAGGDASAFAKSFSPVSGSDYEGFHAGASAASSQKLAWQHATVAKNATSGQEYGSFSQAVSSAKEGDVIELAANATVNGALAVTQRNLTIDLKSHTLVVRAAKDAQGTASLTQGAVAFSGAGELSIENGTLDVQVGCDVETSSTASNPYQGFAVAGGGALCLTGVAATVTYTGSSSTNPQVTLYGASNAAGTFKLSQSSKLTVRAASASGAFGASTVAGIFGAGSKQTDSLAVDSSSSVAVENSAKAIVQGQIAYPDGALTGTNSSNNADLVELSVEPSDALYAEIQQQFKKDAKFDSPLDENGEVYDTGIYYASAMELPSGLTVWAFSDPVAADQAGRLDAIEATHFFVRSDYQVPLDAYGVWAQKGYTGTVSVEGRVSASTTQGHAFGAYVPEGASWSVSESRFSARATGSEYRASLGKFDLSRTVAFEKEQTRAVVYPSNASYREIACVKPQAQAVAYAGQTSEAEVEGGVAFDTLFSSMNGNVAVTFSNIRTSSGATTSQTASVARGKTLAASGARVPSPSDYTAGDVTYRFIGWRLASAAASSYAYDPEALRNDIAIDANITGVSDGAIEFDAVYVPVKSGQHLVKFRVEYGVYAMAAAIGAQPTFADCTGGSDSPQRLTSVSNSQYTVTFKGWAADATGACDYRQGETVYDSAIPAVRGDVTYSARFESELVKTTLGLFYMRKMTDGTYAYTGESVKDVDWRADAISVADARMKVGDSLTQNGVTYTLLGWSPRVSDKEPLYTDTLPLAGGGDMLSDKTTYYAIYRQVEKTYDVKFFVNGELYSSASAVPASMTLYNAWNASSNASEPTSTKEGETFKGWNADANASTYYRASMKKIGEIAAADDGDEINLYAIWSSATDKPADGGDTPSAPDTPGAPDAPGGADAGSDAGTGSGADAGTGGSAAGVALPASGSQGASLSASGGGASLASALKSSAVSDGAADGEAADDADAADVATLSAVDAQEAGADAQDVADAQAEAKDAEDSSNAAGVIGVIVAALAAIGAVAWWFMRRRAGDALEGDDDLPAPDDAAADGAAAKEEGIRF